MTKLIRNGAIVALVGVLILVGALAAGSATASAQDCGKQKYWIRIYVWESGYPVGQTSRIYVYLEGGESQFQDTNEHGYVEFEIPAGAEILGIGYMSESGAYTQGETYFWNGDEFRTFVGQACQFFRIRQNLVWVEPEAVPAAVPTEPPVAVATIDGNVAIQAGGGTITQTSSVASVGVSPVITVEVIIKNEFHLFNNWFNSSSESVPPKEPAWWSWQNPLTPLVCFLLLPFPLAVLVGFLLGLYYLANGRLPYWAVPPGTERIPRGWNQE